MVEKAILSIFTNPAEILFEFSDGNSIPGIQTIRNIEQDQQNKFLFNRFLVASFNIHKYVWHNN